MRCTLTSLAAQDLQILFDDAHLRGQVRDALQLGKHMRPQHHRDANVRLFQGILRRRIDLARAQCDGNTKLPQLTTHQIDRGRAFALEMFTQSNQPTHLLLHVGLDRHG